MLAIMQRIAVTYKDIKFNYIDLEYITANLMKTHSTRELREMDESTFKKQVDGIIKNQ